MMEFWTVVNFISVILGTTMAIVVKSIPIKVLGLIAVFSGVLFLSSGGVV